MALALALTIVLSLLSFIVPATRTVLVLASSMSTLSVPPAVKVPMTKKA
jgi:hypothetical protein